MTNNKRFKKLSILLVVAMLLSLIPATLGFAATTPVDTIKVSAFVSRLYTVALNRDAEPTGLAYWTDQLATRKQTAAQAIRWIMLESSEFTGRNLTDSQFVDVAYWTFFDRAPEAGGKAYWLGELAKGYSRNYAIKAMINAPTMEFQYLCKAAGIVVGNIRVIVADYPSSAPTPAPTETVSQKNALSMAKSYLDYTAFSKTGLIEQLEFEGFNTKDATYGADNCGADWMEQAVLMAKSYLEYSAFSRAELIEQLEFEGFTPEQAEFGIDATGL